MVMKKSEAISLLRDIILCHMNCQCCSTEEEMYSKILEEIVLKIGLYFPFKSIAETGLSKLVATLRVATEALEKIQKIVDEQAENEGLWSVPIGRLQTISEANLQHELRVLHATIETYGISKLAELAKEK
jgi:hypothetical protein